MTTLATKIKTLSELGNFLLYYTENEVEEHLPLIKNENGWFTKDSIISSLKGISFMLNPEKLEDWLNEYQDKHIASEKHVGLILAGNIPAVGFHDIMCTYISGHQALIKCSQQDRFLIHLIVDKIKELDPSAKMTCVEKLESQDAVIATGSDNSARYFHQYFGKYPHIIRKNRTSIALLDGTESEEDLITLSEDVLDYFGLGCRNVSKLLIPQDFDLVRLGDLWTRNQSIINHHKYANNYDYNKSIYLVNREEHLDYGYLLLKKSVDLVSPVAVLYYDTYSDITEAEKYIDIHQDKIQCVVSKAETLVDTKKIGTAQLPEVWDYADNINTLDFLFSL